MNTKRGGLFMRIRGRSLLASKEQGDEGIALLMALFVMLMVTTLAVGLLAVVLNETRPTQFQRKLTRTINAADSGLQTVLNELRAANNGAGTGVLSKLPCTAGKATFTFSDGSTKTADGAKFSGSVGPAAGTSTYTAYVAYYASDPSSWYSDSTQWGNFANTGTGTNAQAMTCPLTSVPAYAFVQSVGRGDAVSGLASTIGNRAETATYQFNTTNVNIPGGRILEFGTTTCIEAGANGVVQVGSTMTLQPCQAIGYAPQMWSYRTDLSIEYEGNAALDLCINSSSVAGSVPTLQKCTYTDAQLAAAITAQTPIQTYPYLSGQQVQEWGFNDNGHFATAANDGNVTSNSPSTVPGTCLQPQGADDSTAATPPAPLIVAACGGGTTGYTAWNPDPQVGAGKAGTITSGVPDPVNGTGQFVNYAEFGRCLDITGQDVNADHLIDYPCKQAPDSSKLTFNQVWSFSGSGPGSTGTMSVTVSSGSKYCLTAPVLPGTWATTTPCNGSTAQKWTPTGAVSGNYAGSYELISSGGLCLEADSTIQPTYLSSTITVVACDGTAKQKWNAPANAITDSVSNINENQGVK